MSNPICAQSPAIYHTLPKVPKSREPIRTGLRVLLTWHGIDNFLLQRNATIPQQVNRTLKTTGVRENSKKERGIDTEPGQKAEARDGRE
jgi:hypothetical protein